MTVTVRYAVHGDEAAIMSLLEEFAFATAARCVADEHSVSRFLAGPDETILLAVDEALVVGMLSFSTRPHLLHGAESADIDIFVVRPERRGEGIGTTLLNTARHLLREAEVATVTACVGAENTRAQDLLYDAGLTDASMRLEEAL